MISREAAATRYRASNITAALGFVAATHVAANGHDGSVAAPEDDDRAAGDKRQAR